MTCKDQIKICWTCLWRCHFFAASGKSFWAILSSCTIFIMSGCKQLPQHSINSIHLASLKLHVRQLWSLKLKEKKLCTDTRAFTRTGPVVLQTAVFKKACVTCCSSSSEENNPTVLCWRKLTLYLYLCAPCELRVCVCQEGAEIDRAVGSNAGPFKQTSNTLFLSWFISQIVFSEVSQLHSDDDNCCYKCP